MRRISIIIYLNLDSGDFLSVHDKIMIVFDNIIQRKKKRFKPKLLQLHNHAFEI